MKPDTFGWLDVEYIGELLAERFPAEDPLRVRFPALKRMVSELPGFAEEPGHPVNERILEEIQRHWLEAWREAREGGGARADDED